MGNEIVRTPNLDEIAKRGMVFDDAWVANPVCMPNRSSIMTGRLPSAHGCIFNDRSLDWNSNTFVRRFRAAGYRTGLLGKSHLQHGPSRNSVHPVRSSGMLAKSHHPSGWDELEDFENYVDGTDLHIEDFYGFDHVEFSLEHGASVLGHHLTWALSRGGRREDLVAPMSPESPGLDRAERCGRSIDPRMVRNYIRPALLRIGLLRSSKKLLNKTSRFLLGPLSPTPITR